MAGAGATEVPAVSTSVIEPSSTQKSTLVMIASLKNTARFILTAKLFMTATPHYQRISISPRPPRQRQ